MECNRCGAQCEKPARQNEYIVHRCGDGLQWCAHLRAHLPNLGLHATPAQVKASVARGGRAGGKAISKRYGAA